MAIFVAGARGDGATVGVVKDRSADYVLIQPTNGEASRRHWLTAATRPSETPAPAVAAAVAGVNTGDEIEVRYSGDERRRIEAVKVLRRAAMVNAIAAVTRPASAPSPGTPGEGRGGGLPDAARIAATQQTPSLALPRGTGRGDQTPTNADSDASGHSLGEKVNAAIDDALAVTGRITELPIWALLAGVFVVGGIVRFAARRLEKWNRPVAAGRVRAVGRVLGVLVVALLIDRKLSRLQTEVDGLRAKVSGDAIAAVDKGTIGGPAKVARTRLVDTAAAQQALAAHFKDITLKATAYDAATDVVQLRLGDPQISAYLAVVDLTHPGVRIRLGTDLTQKTLTSAFAKANDCSLAINGEAGQSPAMNSGLGVWRGHMVYQGKTISREDASIPRPFLGFDGGNRAAFTAMSSKDRTPSAALPTVIWGRLDSIVSGVVQTENARNRQPRTAMGIGANGTRLYLLVVDGRQRGYSVGMTRGEVGYTLAAFGCDNAMLCDEGGSSCMYLRDSGGIVNAPSDGEERPTYTHFGVSVAR